ncbi:MAG: SDR family NAD(P)-dependent oxidoreductase [Pseudomonadota bacterium]
MPEGRPIALIVGAGDAIGAAIARRFAEGGFDVAMGRRRGERLVPLVEELQAHGGRAVGYTMDARQEESVEEVFAKAEAELGPLDLVIFNVGGNVRFPLRDTTSRVFRKVWEMACYAGFLTAREAARYMVPRGRGALFFTGATASMRGAAGYAAFAAGKAGLRALAQATARELGPENIHVAHLVIDAGVDTPFVRERLTEAGTDPAKLPPETLMQPSSVAAAYWQLYHQPRDAWTFEMDVRPFRETW